jgi:hypothetical protein
MFQSYEYAEHFGYDEKINKYRYLYKIIDSDFVEEVATNGANVCSLVSALIEVYEKQNLNVAANLALLFQYYHDRSGIKISFLINLNKKYNSKYLKYADAVENYMVWM